MFSAAMLSVAVGVSALGGSALASSSSSNPAAVAAGSEKKPKTVVAVAKSSADFSTLVKAVVAAKLVKALSGKGPFTVFAPTNDAFAAIPAADLASLLADPQALGDILKYHVVPGKILAKDLQPTQTVKTLQGEELTITVNDDGTATITDANGSTVNITATDLKAKNGVVHVIDGVLQPAA